MGIPQTVCRPLLLWPLTEPGMPYTQPQQMSLHPTGSSPRLCTLYVLIQVHTLCARTDTSHWTLMYTCYLPGCCYNISIFQVRRPSIGNLQGHIASYWSDLHPGLLDHKASVLTATQIATQMPALWTEIPANWLPLLNSALWIQRLCFNCYCIPITSHCAQGNVEDAQ